MCVCFPKSVSMAFSDSYVITLSFPDLPCYDVVELGFC